MTGRTLALTVALAASVTIATNTTHAQSEDAWEVRYPHLEFGIDVGVMLWNGVDRNVVRPGAVDSMAPGFSFNGNVEDHMERQSPVLRGVGVGSTRVDRVAIALYEGASHGGWRVEAENG